MENKRETNLTIARLNKMFDVEKLIEKEPELFEELVKDYPLKDGVYLFEVIAEKKVTDGVLSNLLQINRDLYISSKGHDPNHVATPRYVVECIYSIIGIKTFNNIWFPFNHYDSEFKLKADELNLMYKATHIFDDLGNDFFETEPPENCDLLISNPPFDIQNKIIERTLYLAETNKIKAFALLLPLSTLETSKTW